MSGAVGILWALAGLGLGVWLGGKLVQKRLGRRLDDQQRALERARSAALTDPLTKLWNRAAFDEQLRLWTAMCRRYGGFVSLILFDLDGFKQINDRNGHTAGDAALVHLAGILRESSRESDFSARVGGDEFAMLLPHTGLDGARTLAERIRERVERSSGPWPPEFPRDAPDSASEPAAAAVPIRVSAGIADFQGDQDAARFVALADQALYAAKQAGGNRVATNEAETPAGHRASDRSTR